MDELNLIQDNEIKPVMERVEESIVSESESESLEDMETFEDDDLLSAESVAIDNNKKFNPKSIETGEFINKDLVPIEKMKCIVPHKLLEAIRTIEIGVNRKFGSSNEFSIFIHGDYDADGNLLVNEDFYIPKQNVSGATVDYQEEPQPFYNGCLHKHPSGCTSFSGTDKKYINSNFDFSLLYVNSKITKGIVNIPYDGKHRIQCDLNIQIDSEQVVCDINIDNITKVRPPIVEKYNPYPLDAKEVNTPKLLIPGFQGSSGPAKVVENDLILPHVMNPHVQQDDFIEQDAFEFDELGRPFTVPDYTQESFPF